MTTPEALIEKGRQLVVATNVAQAASESVRVVLNTQVPPDRRPEPAVTEAILEIFRGKLEGMVAEIYARHYSEATLDAALAFFMGPAGREIDFKRIAVDSEVQAKSRDLGEEVMRELLRRKVQ